MLVDEPPFVFVGELVEYCAGVGGSAAAVIDSQGKSGLFSLEAEELRSGGGGQLGEAGAGPG